MNQLDVEILYPKIVTFTIGKRSGKQLEFNKYVEQYAQEVQNRQANEIKKEIRKKPVIFKYYGVTKW